MFEPNWHPSSDIQTENIGIHTTIGQYCVIFPDAKIGSGCRISAHVMIENNVLVGDNVIIGSGVKIMPGVCIEDNVVIGVNTSCGSNFSTNPLDHEISLVRTVIRAGALVGSNVTIQPGIEIARGAEIESGSVVVSSVPDNAIVSGSPARIVGYTRTWKEAVIEKASWTQDRTPPLLDNTSVRGVTIHRFPIVPDMRGSLTVGEFDRQIPFIPYRYFMVFNVPSKETRGEHAHLACHQFLICLRGSCAVLADDGVNRIEVLLDSLDKGVYLPPMIWGVQYKYSEDAVLLVFASHHYDPNDYIRDYSQFLSMVGNK